MKKTMYPGLTFRGRALEYLSGIAFGHILTPAGAPQRFVVGCTECKVSLFYGLQPPGTELDQSWYENAAKQAAIDLTAKKCPHGHTLLHWLSPKREALIGDIVNNLAQDLVAEHPLVALW